MDTPDVDLAAFFAMAFAEDDDRDTSADFPHPADPLAAEISGALARAARARVALTELVEAFEDNNNAVGLQPEDEDPVAVLARLFTDEQDSARGSTAGKEANAREQPARIGKPVRRKKFLLDGPPRLPNIPLKRKSSTAGDSEADFDALTKVESSAVEQVENSKSKPDDEMIPPVLEEPDIDDDGSRTLDPSKRMRLSAAMDRARQKAATGKSGFIRYKARSCKMGDDTGFELRLLFQRALKDYSEDDIEGPEDVLTGIKTTLRSYLDYQSDHNMRILFHLQATTSEERRLPVTWTPDQPFPFPAPLAADAAIPEDFQRYVDNALGTETRESAWQRRVDNMNAKARRNPGDEELKVDVDREYLYYLYRLNGSYCWYFGVEGTWEENATLGLSIDRIDSTLGYFSLSGSIPKELGNLSNLKYLLLNLNTLSGTIPSEFAVTESLGKLPNIEILDLQNNYFNGTATASLSGVLLSVIKGNCFSTVENSTKYFFEVTQRPKSECNAFYGISASTSSATALPAPQTSSSQPPLAAIIGVLVVAAVAAFFISRRRRNGSASAKPSAA
ncbi:hypothetical protein HDU96_000453 [Phlyctochytrium bullatum]|nr:hypothetical protein HDU96_000453 [Phlyctochytrium bullatum]